MSTASPARAKPTAVPKKRRRARRRQQRRNDAGEEIAAEAAAVIGGEAADPLWQRDFEEPGEVARENRQQRGHQDEKGGMLKLQAPPDRKSGRLEKQHCGGEQQKGADDAGGAGEKTAPDRRARPTGMRGNGEEFDRQDRQNAGHEIEDEPPE